MIQFVSHVLPASLEESCAQRAEFKVMWDQMKRTSIGFPLIGASPKKLPRPLSNRPFTGGSRLMCGVRPSSHQIDHCIVFGLYERSATARYAPCSALIVYSSTFARPPI